MSNPLPLTITGAPIGNDPDPNSTPPTRIWPSPPHATSGDDASGIAFELKDGTSLTGQLWMQVDTSLWGKVGAAVTVLVGAVSTPIPVVGGGALHFFQVTASVGNPTELYAGFSDIGAGQSVTVSNLPATQTIARRLASSVSDSAQQSVTAKAALTSLAVANRLIIQADYSNTTNVRLGPDATVGTSRGVQLAPGEAWEFFVANANELSAIAESGTCKINVLAE